MFYLNWLVHGRPDAVRPTEEALKRAASMITKFQRDSEIDTSEKCGEGGHHRDDEINVGSVKPGNTIDEEANIEQETADEVTSWENRNRDIPDVPQDEQRVKILLLHGPDAEVHLMKGRDKNENDGQGEQSNREL